MLHFDHILSGCLPTQTNVHVHGPRPIACASMTCELYMSVFVIDRHISVQSKCSLFRLNHKEIQGKNGCFPPVVLAIVSLLCNLILL